MSRHHTELTESQMQRITRALADPQRFAILERIAAEREVACKQLVAEFPVTQATISHHLKELVAADLIQSRRVGQCAMLSRRDAILNDYLGQLSLRLTPEIADDGSQALRTTINLDVECGPSGSGVDEESEVSDDIDPSSAPAASSPNT